MRYSFEVCGKTNLLEVSEVGASSLIPSGQARDTKRLPVNQPSFLDRRTICASRGNVNSF